MVPFAQLLNSNLFLLYSNLFLILYLGILHVYTDI